MRSTIIRAMQNLEVLRRMMRTMVLCVFAAFTATTWLATLANGAAASADAQRPSQSAVVAQSDRYTTTLLRARSSPGNAGEPHIELAFRNTIPTYRLSGDGTSDVTIALMGTLRATNAATSFAGSETLKNVTFDVVGSDLNITFHAASPVNARVSVGRGLTLAIDLVAASTARATIPFGTLPGVAPERVPGAEVTSPKPGETIEVVPLKYADVSEIVGLLVAGQQIPSNDAFAPQAQNFGSGGISSIGGGGFGGIPTSFGSSASYGAAASSTSLGQQINENIGVDRRMNAIVLSGPADVIEHFKGIIAKLDLPLPSVILETQVVELTDSAAKDVGIDFTSGGGPIASGSFGIKSDSLGSGSGGIQAAVYDQVARGHGKIIARPRVVAQNGSSAQIITGDALPIVTSIAVSGVNAVSQQVQYVNVGVSLQIQPRISTDGFVTTHVFSQVSSVTGYQQGYPTLSQREATTSATVRDGESFVIGGLVQQNEINNFAKIPGFGDLPIIGGFFRLRHDRSSTTNLYIIITPHIIKLGSNAT